MERDTYLSAVRNMILPVLWSRFHHQANLPRGVFDHRQSEVQRSRFRAFLPSFVVSTMVLVLVTSAFGGPTSAPPNLRGTGYNIGDTPFDFTGVDQFGNQVSLYELYGEFVVLDFCAMWCPPCNLEASQGLLTQAVSDATNQRVHVRFVQVLLQNQRVEPATPSDVQTWIKVYRLNYPVLSVPDAEYSTVINQLQNYGAVLGMPGGAFPTHVVLGPDLKIIGLQLGEANDAAVTDILLSSFRTTPAYLVFNLLALVDDYQLPPQTTFRLDSNLNGALEASMHTPDTIAACENLKAFVHTVNQMSRWELTLAQAMQITDAAKPVQIALGCIPPEALTLTSLTLNTTSVIAGKSAQATVMLSGPAPLEGEVVTLTSSNTTVATVPQSIPIVQGTRTASFTVTSTGLATDTITISASFAGGTVSATLSVYTITK
jgi:peroxiredoxin